MALAGLTSSSDQSSELFLWHRRLGHHSFRKMKRFIPSLFINESFLYCETCFQAKSHQIRYPSSFSNKSIIPFEMIDFDV